ncbi:hypothetical protein M408DRAFT_67481 [Serendipita vermifera MAFF 305830]|uniref:Gti1/Pac2 family protein n=1 Tax=Serendipita vermifera MAFF 305830 TaxID=933852 RepID=A0A0C3BCB3_SERVB|nr:hypothetical protein M408DRAFT_67481 [Serendipita vermifera MAFF 305830]
MSSPPEEEVTSNADNEGSGWPEPPWSGWIETTGDALLILEAARRGLIPRVTRRLVDSERKMITSGSVFVFDEDESGIKRWTDGFIWSPSRILGNFLLYRETDKRSGNRAKTDQDSAEQDSSQTKKGKPNASQALTHGLDKHRERLLLGSLTNSHKFKVDGMIKKTFSLTIAGVSQHLISYYRVEDVENGRLRSPSSLPELATLEISPEYLDKTHFRQPPRVEYGPDGVPRYRGEADDPDLETIIRAADKSSRRFDPYGATSPKRAKKPKSQRTASQSDADTTTQYPADGYNYPQYPGYPYGPTGYPYMQYPVNASADGTTPDGAPYGPYGGYYWPGYPPAGPPMIEGPSEDDDDGDDKADADEDTTPGAA